MENYVKKEVDFEGNVRYCNSKGQNHRLDGPAVEWLDGDKAWWVNDKLHRLDGPAIVSFNDSTEWWLRGIQYTKSQHGRLALFSVLEPRRIILGSMK